MIKIFASLFMIGVVALPSQVQARMRILKMTTQLHNPGRIHARTLTLTTQLQNYGGAGTYLEFYVTDASGKYHKTLWVAGQKSKYYRHLRDRARDQARDGGLSPREFDGISGASVGSGRMLKVKVELANVLLDTGYEIRVDSEVEDGRGNIADARAPLTTKGVGKPVTGRGIVRSFSYDM